MYKFLTVEGSCGSPYNVSQCEQHANKMAEQGFYLVQVYQSSTSTCFCGPKSVLVMVFRKMA